MGAELELNVSHSILVLAAGEMWRGRYSIKAIAEERVRNSLYRLKAIPPRRCPLQPGSLQTLMLW